MKLRFEVNQAECFRRGIDCPKSIVTVEVAPLELNEQLRNLIADRLHGIDVCRLLLDKDGNPSKESKQRIQADEPTLDSLIEAVRLDQELVRCEVELKTQTTV